MRLAARGWPRVAGRLRLDMAAFRDLAAFAQFGSDLDKATMAQLNRGLRLQEVLKQAQYAPMSVENQTMALFAGVNGFMDQVPVDRVKAWEHDFLRYMETSTPEVGRTIAEKKAIPPETETKLREALQAFNAGWV